MAQAGNLCAKKLLEILQGPGSLAHFIEEVALRESVELAPIPISRIVALNATFELVEKSAGAKYPLIHIYCEKVVNGLREKFRTFSGKAHMAMEIRVSQDRLEGTEKQLQLYVDAATSVLDSHRGNWDGEAFYAGGWEAAFGQVKQGGKHFIQTAKITFAVDVSIQ